MERKDKLQELYDEFGGDPRVVASVSDEDLRAAQEKVYKDKFLPNGWPKKPQRENKDSAWRSDGLRP
ncbi:hypothetical protein HYS03_02640 [Candidatus Woesebacteria bacterium]|nr:hypothetical protein [Candidatus Woesebacteria bacterium]